MDPHIPQYVKYRDRIDYCVICNCRNKKGGEGQAYSKFGSNFSVFGRSSDNTVFRVAGVSKAYPGYSINWSEFTTLSTHSGQTDGGLETISRCDGLADLSRMLKPDQPDCLTCPRAFVVHQCCLRILEHWIDWRGQHYEIVENALVSIEAFYDAVDRRVDRDENRLAQVSSTSAKKPGHLSYPRDREPTLLVDPLEERYWVGYVKHQLCSAFTREEKSQESKLSETTTMTRVSDVSTRLGESKSQTTISDLSDDILLLIVDYLPAKSLISLHRCTRFFATRFPLDQNFWRKHLMSNNLLGFTWDLRKVMWWDPVLSHWDSDEALHWNWRRLGRALSQDKALGENADKARATLGLRARRDIWKNIADVERSHFRELRKAELRRIAPTKPRRGAPLRSFA